MPKRLNSINQQSAKRPVFSTGKTNHRRGKKTTIKGKTLKPLAKFNPALRKVAQGRMNLTKADDSSSSSSLYPPSIKFDTDPIYAGYTKPASSSKLKVKVTVYVDPPSESSTIELVRGGAVASRVRLDNQKYHSDGSITVDIYGQDASPANLTNSDCLLWARYKPTNKIIAHSPIWVVIPTAIGRPHPEATGSVDPINQVADRNTSPTYFGSLSSSQAVLWTYWAQWLTIPVVDQFFNPINSLYNGMEVFEYNNNISQFSSINELLTNGTYRDPVFLFIYKSGSTSVPYIVSKSGAEAASWPTDAPEDFLITSPQDQEIRVRIAGFELKAVGSDGITLSSPAISGRTIAGPSINEIDVSWP